MDKEQAINLAKRYKEMVAEKLPLKALYLYGSYSKGNYRAGSYLQKIWTILFIVILECYSKRHLGLYKES